MNEQDPNSARARLQALRAIPERQRTDAEWDELNELEIRLAAGNREGASQQHSRGNVPPPQNRSGPGGDQQRHGKRQGKRHHHQKPNKPR